MRPSTRSPMVKTNFKLSEPSEKNPAQDTHPTKKDLPVQYETPENRILHHLTDWYT